MKKSDYKTLENKYKEAKNIREQISEIEKLIAHDKRLKSFRMGESTVRICHSARSIRDSVSVRLSDEVFRKAVIPALKITLKELRVEYKLLPSLNFQN